MFLGAKERNEMSTQAEKVKAQKMAFDSQHIQPWHRHLIGSAELWSLFIAESERRSQGLTLETLCDMVLGESAEDRSDEALVSGVRKLIQHKAWNDSHPTA